MLTGTNSCCIQTQQLSCYCRNCIEEEYEACKNGGCICTWQAVQLEAESGQQTRETRSQVIENLSSIKDLLTKGTVMAIATGDPG